MRGSVWIDGSHAGPDRVLICRWRLCQLVDSNVGEALVVNEVVLAKFVLLDDFIWNYRDVDLHIFGSGESVG